MCRGQRFTCGLYQMTHKSPAPHDAQQCAARQAGMVACVISLIIGIVPEQREHPCAIGESLCSLCLLLTQNRSPLEKPCVAFVGVFFCSA